MNPYDQKMPKPLYRDYSAAGLRAPKEKKERQPRDRTERAGGGEKRPLSLAAMICGLCAIAFLFIPVPFSILIALVCGIAGMVLASQARKKEGRNGLNRTGLATSIIGVVLIGLLVLLFVALFAAGATFLGSMGGFTGIEDMLGSAFSDIGSQAGFTADGTMSEGWLPDGTVISEDWQDAQDGSVRYDAEWEETNPSADDGEAGGYEVIWEDGAPSEVYSETGWAEVYPDAAADAYGSEAVIPESPVQGADPGQMVPEPAYDMQPAA